MILVSSCYHFHVLYIAFLKKVEGVKGENSQDEQTLLLTIQGLCWMDMKKFLLSQETTILPFNIFVIAVWPQLRYATQQMDSRCKQHLISDNVIGRIAHFVHAGFSIGLERKFTKM